MDEFDGASLLEPQVEQRNLVFLPVHHGMRLDRALVELVPEFSRSYLQQLIEQGDVLVDQIPAMRRCGFDSFIANAPVDRATLDKSLNRYDHVYQPAADAALPVWKLRHG